MTRPAGTDEAGTDGDSGVPGPVDVHTHAMPLPLLQWLASRGLADTTALDQGLVRIDPAVSGVGPGAPLPCPPAQYRTGPRLAAMDETGVGHHAVALPPFLMGSLMEDAGLLADLVRRGNDALAEYTASAPSRLHALGTVPAGHPWAADEARRCVDELGMSGMVIGSRGGGRELDHRVHEDLWSYLADHEVFTFLHPSVPVEPARTRDHWLAQLAGFPMETALAVARLVLGGVLERYPVPLCLAHGGGCLPSLRGRLDLGWARKEAARSTLLPPSAYLDGSLYYDTAVFSTVQLSRLVEDVGADRVLLGTDTPFDLADTDPLGTVRRLGLPQAQRDLVAGGTARRLLRLDDPAPARPPAPAPLTCTEHPSRLNDPNGPSRSNCPNHLDHAKSPNPRSPSSGRRRPTAGGRVPDAARPGLPP